VIKMQPLVF